MITRPLRRAALRRGGRGEEERDPRNEEPDYNACVPRHYVPCRRRHRRRRS